MEKTSITISAEGRVRGMKDGIHPSGYTQRKQTMRTNADRIRSMSDEELADFIRELNERCLAGAGMVDCSRNEECIDCKGIVLAWLQSEAAE